jgi:hypothetical protein
MDLKMRSEDITTAGVSWDCDVKNGDVPIVTDEKEEIQSATLAGFLIVGTIPQLPEAGVPWTDYLTGKITFGVLDFYVRDSMSAAGKSEYFPKYDVENDQLTMKVGKVTQEEINGI